MQTGNNNHLTPRRHFLKHLGLGAMGIGFMPSFYDDISSLFAGATLPRSTPEEQGMSSQGILEFLQAAAAGRNEIHSIMVLRHGNVVAEGWWSPFQPEFKHTLYSLSKSFTSTAIGFAVSEGLLTVDDPVLKFFPEDKPAEISQNLADMTIKDLLTMTTGHGSDSMGDLRNSDGNWPKAFLAKDVEYKPGTHFLYNTGATYMLSAIIQKLAGKTLIEYLGPRLFDPLGIEGHDWETCPQGINTGGYGLRVKTEDIAHFGQLYLDKGMWKGKQLLPAAWIEEATMKQTESQEGNGDWSQGYGYQFWRCTPGCYRGDGAFGQYCIVIPQKDAVVAMTSESVSMPESMKLVWDYLLPAMKDDTKLMPDKKSQAALKKALKSLAIESPKQMTHVKMEKMLDEKVFDVSTNELGVQTLSFKFEPKVCMVTLKDDFGTHRVHCGLDEWIVGDNAREEPTSLLAIRGRTSVPTKIAASATWTDERTLVLTWKYVENVHTDTITVTFSEDSKSAKISFSNSVSTGRNQPDPRADLMCKLS